jgi:MbtH protein
MKIDQAKNRYSNPVLHSVVVNQEGQYAIWPNSGQPPPGWSKTGFVGSSVECSAHIDEVWTDMRPLSLRARGADTLSTTSNQSRVQTE